MKKLIVVMIMFTLSLSMLLLGCSTTPQRASPVKELSPYSGFMELKAGQWVESEMHSSRGVSKMRTELIENSNDLSKYQIIIGEGEGAEVAQIWYDRQAGEAVKYIMKSDTEVVCLDVADAPTTYITADDSSYPADKPGIVEERTEVGGEDIMVAKFITENSEVWVSSDLPFGIVKLVQDGKIRMEVTGFGTIGAKNLFDESDVAQCEEHSTGYTGYPEDEDQY